MSNNAFISNTNSGYYTSANAMNFSDASSEASSTWAQYYAIIRNANIVIHADVVLEEASPAVLEIKSQAHIMKGWLT